MVQLDPGDILQPYLFQAVWCRIARTTSIILYFTAFPVCKNLHNLRQTPRPAAYLHGPLGPWQHGQAIFILDQFVQNCPKYLNSTVFHTIPRIVKKYLQAAALPVACGCATASAQHARQFS